MPLRRHHPPAPTRLLDRVARVLLLVLVCAAPAVTLQLKHAGERGVQSERDLQAVMTELQLQDGLEWRAISGREAPADVAGPLADSRRRVAALLDAVDVGAAEQGADQRLAELTAAYSRAVDAELRLLAAGDHEQAEQFDEEQVDPAFEAAMDDLEEDGAAVSAQAARARRLGDAGLLVTVLLSLLLTSVVQSRRRRAEVARQARQDSEARYRALVDQSSDLVLVTDRAGLVTFLSPSAERLLARTSAGGPVGLLAAVDPDDHGALEAALAAAGPDRPARVDLRVPDGDVLRTFEVTVVDLTAEPSVGGLVLTGHDVTGRLALQREMEHRALHDALTGLPNRALLAERFAAALRAPAEDGATGLLLIDLDRFKEVNDTFGHHYGDALLTQVGPRLRGVLRPQDTVVRLGGDEFAVLLPGLTGPDGLSDVAAVAGHLREALTVPFRVEDVDLDVEASIGMVLSGRHGDDPTTLLQRADIAMYAAKTQGLGSAAYDPAADGHSPARLALLGDLRRALDRGGLVLHYQPKTSISTGEVVGAEALVRWQHPERGLLFPDTFIPLAEHTGLIGPLTQHVLGAALAQARAWADDGQPLVVSVNLSARNLLDDGLPAAVAGLLAEHGVPADLLELEVTESAIMSEPARAHRLLEALSALGVRLSIDDFGAGYTSLGQLRTLPVTELKIDKSFVLTMTQDTSNALIVRSIVGLGHDLGLTLVAEGVEDAQVLDALAGYGCDVAQGYHLCRPVPAPALDAWRAARALTPRAPVPAAAAVR